MSTWLSDLEKRNPKLANAYKIVGNQDRQSLKNMVKALEMFGGFMNSESDNQRLAAAKYILRNKK